MDLQTRKINFIQEFLRTANSNIVDKFEKMLKQERQKIYEKEITPMSLESFNSMIDQAEDDVANGRVVEAKNLKEEIKKWK